MKISKKDGEAILASLRKHVPSAVEAIDRREAYRKMFDDVRDPFFGGASYLDGFCEGFLAGLVSKSRGHG